MPTLALASLTHCRASSKRVTNQRGTNATAEWYYIRRAKPKSDQRLL